MCNTKLHFTHDCEACVSLGSFEYTGTENYPKKYDLYYCPTGGLFGPTVVARYGDYGPEYFSYIGRTATNPAICEAVRRVDEKGWELE